MRSLIKHVLKHYWKVLIVITILTYFQIFFDVFTLVYLSLVFKAISYHEINIAYSILPDIFLFITMSIFVSLLLTICNIYLMSRFTYNLRTKTFDILSISDKIEDYSKIKDVSIISRLVVNVTFEQYFLMFLLKKILFIVVFGIFLINDIVVYNVEIITMLILSSIIITLFFVYNLRRISKDYVVVRKSQIRLTSLLYGKIKNFRLVRYFTNEERENKYFNRKVQKYYDLGNNFLEKLSFSLITSMLVILSFTLLVYLLLTMFVRHEIEVFYILVIMQVMVIIIAYSENIFKLASYYSSIKVRTAEINEILNLEKKVEDNDKVIIERNIEEIEFNNVSLKLDNKDILNNISFNIARGTKTLIYGPVASGKTSIAYLLMKFHTATKGDILINGKNIKEISTTNLREKVTYVPTDALIFTDSLLENIRLGDESITKDDVICACRETLLTEYDIGLDKKLYENDLGYNGDFRQKLSLTRALVHDSDVYIFDNCFSLIDMESRKIILKKIMEKLGNKIIIFLENNNENTYDLDNIILLENTQIISQKKHDKFISDYVLDNHDSVDKMRGE